MRKRQRKRFDHGEPIAKIDTRPLAFVIVFLVIVIVIGRFDPFETAPSVDLPFAVAKPIQQLDDRFVVTISTTRTAELKLQRSQRRELVSVFIPDLQDYLGECRAHLSDGTSVTGHELYDYAFKLLDQLKPDHPRPGGVDRVLETNFREIPLFYIRADRATPWQCVAGAISRLEQAGYPEVGLMTTPFT